MRAPRLLLLALVLTYCALFSRANAQEASATPPAAAAQDSIRLVQEFDVVVVGGTPGGVMAAIGAARGGCTVALLDRTTHLGGLPSNGLTATDIATRGASGGLFLEFTNRNLAYYTNKYGADSPEVKLSSNGYHFEPQVAEQTLLAMVAQQPKISVLLQRQFDCSFDNIRIEKNRLAEITVTNRESGKKEIYRAKVFIDGTYEGDLAAATGAPYRIGRENAWDFGEPMAGQLYKEWEGPLREGTTGFGDNGVQAYNYRLPLTTREDIKLPIEKPANYNREEFVSLIDDIKTGRSTGAPDKKRGELAWDGIGRVVNMKEMPNGLTDANNQHASFLSTDLAEENWAWPTSSWEWRDRFAIRLREYTLGLLYFVQNDPELPEDYRERCKQWGLAKSVYEDNGNFPRQVYVREGRRIEGEYLFTAHDALPLGENLRPPLNARSITASHYALDSHAVHKREPNRAHSEGFFSYPSKPYTVPYGVIVPKTVDGLLVPVSCSATHIGFSTLRMEPCWMALGQAAGVAAGISIHDKVQPRAVKIDKLQTELVAQKAVLVFFKDTAPEHPAYPALQYFALRGLVTDWEAKLDEPVSKQDADAWLAKTKIRKPAAYKPGITTRGELLTMLHAASVK